ncbi:hypothetical protein V5O48_000512 [Marasmius crinis-equi]|uniref:FAD/NAD(P)-binding domain-containing protein n=1 Tax=Marasmius crinis-equi TaxID=585013 RepID=A0ABR3G1N9_9AGAR
MLSGKTSIVIIGAGSAGASIAKSLSGSLDASQHEIVLISPQLYYVHYPSTPRMVVTDAGKLEDQGLVPLDKLFLEGNRKFVQGEAALIDEQAREVELMTGRKVSFDFLVLATGTRWGGPIAFPHDPSKVRRGFIEEKRREFREAKNILLVGGGSVGIELAGELRDLSTQESLSFTATDYFSTPYPDKMRNYMQEQLENRKIEVILGDSVDVPTSGPYQGRSRPAEARG